MKVFVLVVLFCSLAVTRLTEAGRAPGAGDASNPSLTVQISAAPVIADWPFDVRTTWDSDGESRLWISILRAARCGGSVAAGRRLDPAGLIVLDGEPVAASGQRADQLTLTTPDSYLVCAYLGMSADVPDAVTQSRLEITTFGSSDPVSGPSAHAHAVPAWRHITTISQLDGCSAASRACATGVREG